MQQKALFTNFFTSVLIYSKFSDVFFRYRLDFNQIFGLYFYHSLEYICVLHYNSHIELKSLSSNSLY